jgi:hypothetical protein
MGIWTNLRKSRQEHSYEKLLLAYVAIGWAIIAIVCVVSICLFVKGYIVTDHMLYTFAGDVPLWLPSSEQAGSLPSGPTSLTYRPDTAIYLADAMVRYMELYAGNTTAYMARAGTRELAKIYTENGQQLSCLMVDAPSEDAVMILFKGTTTRAEWGTDFAYKSVAPTELVPDAGEARAWFQRAWDSSREFWKRAFKSKGKPISNKDVPKSPEEGLRLLLKRKNPHQKHNHQSLPRFSNPEKTQKLLKSRGVVRTHVPAVNSEIRMHAGFVSFYNEIRGRILEKLATAKRRNVFIMGHSLGGGLTNVCLFDLLSSGAYDSNACCAISIASPRAGNQQFVRFMKERKARLFQIQNSADLVPTVPLSSTPSISEKKQIFAYAHAGNRLSFYYRGRNLKAAHMLEPYQRHLASTQLSTLGPELC